METIADMYIKLGLDTRDFYKSLDEVENDILNYIRNVGNSYLDVLRGVNNELIPIMRSLNGEEIIIEADTEQVFTGIKEIERRLSKPTEKKVDIHADLQNFTKQLQKQLDDAIQNSDDPVHIRRLKGILDRIELNRLSGAHNELYSLTQAQQALERAASLHGDKMAKIEQENAEKIKKVREESGQRTQKLLREVDNINYSLNHSPFEQQIRAIKQWEQESLSSLAKYKDAIKDKNIFEQEAAAIQANALAKERETFEREMDRIKGKTQDLYEKIFEQEHSQRDIDIMRAQKERAKLYEEGIFNPETIEHWYEGELAKIRERATKGEDYIKTPHRPRGRRSGGIEIIDGNEEEGVQLPNRNFYDEIQQKSSQDVANNFGVLTESTQNLVNVQDELQKAIEVFDGEELISNFTSSVDDLVTAQDSLSEAYLKNTQLMQDMAQRISSVNFQQAAVEDSWINKEAARVAFDAIENAGGAVALAGAATVNPMLGAVGGGLALFGGLGNMALDTSNALDSASGNVISSVDTSAINDAIKSVQQEISPLLTELSNTTTNISQNVQQISQREPPQPNITVSPNINIDLGGAYVFDEAMKQAIVDDVATKTTDSIRETFENEVRSSSYGYGN